MIADHAEVVSRKTEAQEDSQQFVDDSEILILCGGLGQLCM